MFKFFLHHQWFFFIFTLAVFVAFSYLVEMNGVSFARLNNSFESYRSYADTSDMVAYFKNASGFINGTWPGDKAFFRAPLFSFFIVLISVFTSDMFVFAIVQLMLYLLILFLTYLTARKLFDEKTALLSMVFLVLYGGFVFWIVVPHSTMLESFLVLCSFFVLLNFRDDFTCGNACLAGFVGGLLSLIRPNFIIIVPPAIIFITLEQYLSSYNFKGIFRPLTLGCLCFALPLLPVIVWNNLHSDHFVLFTTNGFHTYKQGNSYGAKVFSYINPHQPLMSLHSIAFWKHLFSKFLGFWCTVEFPQNVNFYVYRLNSKVLTFLPVNFGVIGGLFIAATCYFVKFWRKYWLLLLFVWGYIATVILFYIIGRFRSPIVPLMIVLGSGFVFKLIQFVRLVHNPVSRKKIAKCVNYKLLVCLTVFCAVFGFSKPFEQYISFGDWKYASDLSANELDLSGYLYALDHANEMYSVPKLVMNALSAEVFLGNAKNAERRLKRILKIHPDDAYLLLTKKEIEMFKQIELGELSGAEWLEYVKASSEQHGHIAFFYRGLSQLLVERKEHGFYPHLVGAYPASFFSH